MYIFKKTQKDDSLRYESFSCLPRKQTVFRFVQIDASFVALLTEPSWSHYEVCLQVLMWLALRYLTISLSLLVDFLVYSCKGLPTADFIWPVRDLLRSLCPFYSVLQDKMLYDDKTLYRHYRTLRRDRRISGGEIVLSFTALTFSFFGSFGNSKLTAFNY